MPELPEVERARKLVAETCVGFKIVSVDAREDKIVYTGGITQEDYVKELEGRTITGCSRKGKIFWLELTGDGRLPVMHFGMTGMIMLKGREPDWYMRKPRKVDRLKTDWPPAKYVKFVLKLEPEANAVGTEPVELAFLDSRRLARLRLVPQPPLSHPPLSALGFDPLLSHPTLPYFLDLLNARPRATIKGVIMDQSFSAGVGNWVADEVLYQAKVHPACPVGKLGEEGKEAVWREMKRVVDIAVEANANHAKFPKDWLFSWRWSKGKKDKNRKEKDESGGIRLSDGRPATLSFITVGGRTTAFIEEVQVLPDGVEYKPPKKKTGKKAASEGSEAESDLSDETGSEKSTKLEDEETITEQKVPVKKVGARGKKAVGDETDVKSKPVRQTKRKKSVSESSLSSIGSDTKPAVSPKRLKIEEPEEDKEKPDLSNEPPRRSSRRKAK